MSLVILSLMLGLAVGPTADTQSDGSSGETSWTAHFERPKGEGKVIRRGQPTVLSRRENGRVESLVCETLGLERQAIRCSLSTGSKVKSWLLVDAPTTDLADPFLVVSGLGDIELFAHVWSYHEALERTKDLGWAVWLFSPQDEKWERQEPRVTTKPGWLSTITAWVPSLGGMNCGNSKCITASGLPANQSWMAACGLGLDLGSLLYLPELGREVVCVDRFGIPVGSYDVDLWFPSYSSALTWGKRKTTIILRGRIDLSTLKE